MVLNEIRANIVLPPSDEGGGLPLGKTEGEIALNPHLSYYEPLPTAKNPRVSARVKFLSTVGYRTVLGNGAVGAGNYIVIYTIIPRS